MNEDMQSALGYILYRPDPCGQGPLWKWVDNGTVLLWNDDTTIIYRDQLIEVLARLAPQGLPPFAAVLMLMGATRNNQAEGVWRLVSNFGLSCAHNAEHADLIGDVGIGLMGVRDLPDDLRVPLDAKATLAEVVFENWQPRTAPAVTEKVLGWLRAGGAMDETENIELAGGTNPTELFRRDLQCLRDGLKHLDEATLRLRGQTGLDETPVPAEVDLPPGERVRGLLKELEDDAELGGLARLTRDLMAAMTLPRAVSEPDELPQGGVSDLTNRGPLDRLLLSELAHDDLTLAVRVATGSALYWRREKPPQPRPRMRSVLLESGLRSWGVPRIFATAVALASAATVDKHTSFVCYRASGTKAVAVDLLSRAGLVTHLAALEPEVHPGKALSAFVETIADGDIDTDAVMVLSEDVYADRDFQRALVDLELSPLLIATVNRAGSFTLLSRSTRGVRVVREAKLDIEKLFTPPTPKQKPLVTEGTTDRPAIFRINPFPLRLSHPIDPKRMGRIEGVGILAVTRDRRLMLWTNRDRERGALQLIENLPRGTLLWCSPELINDRIFAVVGHPGQTEWNLIDIHIDTHEIVIRPIPLRDRSYRGICMHRGMLFVIHRRSVAAFDLETMEKEGSLTIPAGYYLMRDRFFRSGFWNWSALCNKDGLPALIAVPVKHDAIGATLLTMMDCPGIDGPYGITSRGSRYIQPTGEIYKINLGLNPPVTVDAVSKRGDWVILQGKSIANDTMQRKRVHLRTAQVDTVYGDSLSAVERFSEYVSPLSGQLHFVSCTVDPMHRIGLKSRRGRMLYFDRTTDRSAIRFHLYSDKEIAALSAQVFHPLPSSKEQGYRLQCAEWPDGSRVFLDSRGLLHLQSSDKTIPEVTLVLTDGSIAGWCSDGTLFGPTYYTDTKDDPGAIRHVWETALVPFARRLT